MSVLVQVNVSPTLTPSPTFIEDKRCSFPFLLVGNVGFSLNCNSHCWFVAEVEVVDEGWIAYDPVAKLLSISINPLFKTLSMWFILVNLEPPKSLELKSKVSDMSYPLPIELILRAVIDPELVVILKVAPVPD